MYVCLVGLSVCFSVFMLSHAQFHGCPSPASSMAIKVIVCVSGFRAPLCSKSIPLYTSIHCDFKSVK